MPADDSNLIKEYIDKKSSFSCFTLVSKYQHSVFGMCYKILRNREEAEEAAQDVFIKFFDSIGKLREPEKLKSWLLSIAYRTAIDFYRRRKQPMTDLERVPDISATAENDPQKDLQKSQNRALLEQVFDSMDKLDASILSLFYIEDMAVKEIAETLSQSESNIKIRLMRAREYLRKKMNPIYQKEFKI